MLIMLFMYKNVTKKQTRDLVLCIYTLGCSPAQSQSLPGLLHFGTVGDPYWLTFRWVPLLLEGEHPNIPTEFAYHSCSKMYLHSIKTKRIKMQWQNIYCDIVSSKESQRRLMCDASSVLLLPHKWLSSPAFGPTQGLETGSWHPWFNMFNHEREDVVIANTLKESRKYARYRLEQLKSTKLDWIRIYDLWLMTTFFLDCTHNLCNSWVLQQRNSQEQKNAQGKATSFHLIISFDKSPSVASP